ncbi:hypothetical protein ACFVFS_17525 [Kitasatospora sp. NPDC057692]|uniref:zinc finger domain-containing protein n=1 Tax=Kitasatospora sp. NPDC057692 TaxID=3346215 RepID=UPI0036C175C0
MGAPMPPGLRPHRDRPPEWAIPCPVPTCRAKPGTTCHTPTGRRLTAGSHASRLDAWLVHQTTRPAA